MYACLTSVRHLLVFCALSFVSQTMQAQHYMHATFWGRLSVTVPLSKQWEMQVEYWYRTQSDLEHPRWNLFSRQWSQQPRIWLNYRQKNYSIVSYPFSYVYSTPFIGKMTDYNLLPNHTFSSAAGIEGQQKVKKWTFRERAMYECRISKLQNFKPAGRSRFRAMTQYQVTPKWRLTASNEVFFSMPPNKPVHIFDQNWASFSTAFQLNPKYTLDLGYMRNHRERPNGIEFDEENTLTFGLNVRL